MARRYDPVDEDKSGSLATLTPQSPPSLFELTAASSPPDSRHFKVDAVRKLPKPGQHRGKFLVGALASIVSLVAVLALLALCRSNQRKLNSGGAVRRSLSDTEDEEGMSTIIEQCLDLEEELGLRPTASPPSDEAGEGKATLLAMLYESASTFEQMKGIAVQKREGEVHPPPPKIPRLSESWASDPHSQMSAGAFLSHPSGMAMGGAASALDADAWVEEESELVSVEAVDKLYTTNQEGKPGPQHDVSTTLWRHTPLSEEETHISPPSSFAFGRAHSGDDATTPGAWLDGSSANADEQDVQQTVVSTVARYPTVETSSVASTSARSLKTSSKPARGGAGSMPRADAGQDRRVQPTEVDAAQQLQQRAGGTSVLLDGLKGSLSATAVRGTSSGARGPCMPRDILEHPFVRLPVVNPINVRRHFSLLLSMPVGPNADSPMDAYMTMRSLFAKPSLTAEDVDKLMVKADVLIKYAHYKLAEPDRRRTGSHLLTKLSSLFMLFDHLVCTIELLGDMMDTESWWPGFVKTFHTYYHLSEHARTIKSRRLNALVNRLSSALEIYKEGRRPPLEEVIELKRAILSEPAKGTQLANPLWKNWIEDDKEFSSSCRDVRFSSEQTPDGQREPEQP